MKKVLIDFPPKSIFDEYIFKVGTKFCPYLVESQKRKVLFNTKIDIPDGLNTNSIQELILFNSFILIEELRLLRKDNPENALFYCNNLCFHLKDEFSNEKIQEIINWPHWILKCLYTRVGLMFGKFWVNETSMGKNKKRIPSSPINFISIRSAIKPKDSYFFDDNFEFMREMITSIDNGENVHEKFEIKKRGLANFKLLREKQYFQRLKKWSSQKITFE